MRRGESTTPSTTAQRGSVDTKDDPKLDPTSASFDPAAYRKLTPEAKAKIIRATLQRTLNANTKRGTPTS
jgi:hypothetical protein